MGHPPGSSRPRWAVAGLLLFATAILYMDRQTLAAASVRVTLAFGLTQEQYGTLELAFGWSFAAGSLVFGPLADRFGVRLLYPLALLGWSAAGAMTGLCTSYDQLLACRAVLGFCEAGHWPCALVTTQRLLTRAGRGMGNSVLQSGASVGAVLTPLVVLGMFRWADPGEAARSAALAVGGGPGVAATGLPPTVWPLPFLAVAALGPVWAAAWLWTVRRGDLASPPTTGPSVPVWNVVADRRFVVLAVMVLAINLPWQLVRSWLPKFMQEGRGYTESTALLFNSLFYAAADVGCLLTGWATLRLARGGRGVHRSRVLAFAGCCGLTALTVVAAQLPAGWPLLAVLLVIAGGSLGLFPCYYTLSQELSERHMGAVTGLLAAFGWFLSSPFQRWFGKLADALGSFDLGFALAGLPPLVALAVLVLVWPREER